MSVLPCAQPETHATPASAVDAVVVPHTKDLGGFTVRRVLPAAERRTVGSFVFLDHMGPTEFPAGAGIAVRPHPHIGLATVTYLFAGKIIHRDSLGSVQPIVAGDVNWMTAGRGIVHSERSDEADLARPHPLHGLQFWVALPLPHEETDPAFAHHDAAQLPEIARPGAAIRVIAGSAFGVSSPVAILSKLFFADIALKAGHSLTLEAPYAERAAYIVSGSLAIDGISFADGRMVAFRPGAPVTITAESDTRLGFFGGAPLDAPRHLWWNFVSSSTDRIARAKADWKDDRFGVQVPGETEFIPLPE